MMEGKILLLGGTGTLGRAFLKRAKGEDCEIYVFSRDVFKQIELKKQCPGVKFVLGSVTDYDALYLIMQGMDTVVHMAAQKVIPLGETNVLETIDVNLIGSINVAAAAVAAGVKHVVGISTDKAAHPCNTYGATKYLMEKAFQEYAQAQTATKFHIVRYGNVLGSTGSVVNVWRQHLEEYGKVYATNGSMTRFWLTSSDAVDLILHSLTEPSGTISVPRCPALRMDKLAKYVLPEGTEVEYTGIRPGEKMYEELVTQEEAPYIEPGLSRIPAFYVMRLWPTTSDTYDDLNEGYDSNLADRWLSKEELLKMIGE